MPGQFDAALGDAAEVRNADLRFHEARDRVHEAFGLTQRQVEYLTYQNGSFYGVIGIHLWSAAYAAINCIGYLHALFKSCSVQPLDGTSPLTQQIVCLQITDSSRRLIFPTYQLIFKTLAFLSIIEYDLTNVIS